MRVNVSRHRKIAEGPSDIRRRREYKLIPLVFYINYLLGTLI